MIPTGEHFNVQDIPEAFEFINDDVIKPLQEKFNFATKAISSIDFKEIGLGQHIIIMETNDDEQATNHPMIKETLQSHLLETVDNIEVTWWTPWTIIITLTYSH